MAIVTRVDLLKNRRTKIVATVGPASADEDILTRLIEAGVNVFRLNMSHGDHHSHARAFENITACAKALKQPVAVLADLAGPKIRTGRFEAGGIDLRDNEEVIVTVRQVTGRHGLIPSQYESLANDVARGDRILLDDGALELLVEGVEGTEVSCRVLHGGRLLDHKGINLPGIAVSAPSMTGKDIDDARFALGLGVDFIALSFVRTAEDVEQLRSLIRRERGQAHIVAKIEKPEALENAEAILDVTDAVMVARGDLGVELPPEEVPVAQNQLIEMARSKGKPVIVATQMLESMITSSRPTRAEVTDVSHAVDSGADALMLSAETASGKHPVEAVNIMDRVARQTEAHLWRRGIYGHIGGDLERPLPVWHVVANATSEMSRDLMARGVLVISRSGTSASTVSAARPAAPVVAITGNLEVYRRMALLWGVIPLLEDEAGRAKPNEVARRVAHELDLAGSGDYVLLVRGFHDDPQLNSPSITVITV